MLILLTCNQMLLFLLSWEFHRISGFIEIWHDFEVTKKDIWSVGHGLQKKIRSRKEYKIWIHSMDFLENGWAWESECLHGWFSISRIGRQKRCGLCWCRIAGWVFELFLGDEFVLDLCFFEDPRGRWITCLSKGCTRHFLEKTLAISDCQFLKHWFLKVHFYFLFESWQFIF